MEPVEITHIRDEDVLRNMWHRTEDFGRKKEIRAHMYRLREERLRNLYVADMADATKTTSTAALVTSSSTTSAKTTSAAQQLIESSTTTHHQHISSGATDAVDEVMSVVKHSSAPSHENLLVDQSYQSLKTKEVRDSESPTGDGTALRVERHVEHPDAHTEIVTEQSQLRDGGRLLTKSIESHRSDANSKRDYSEQNVVETKSVGTDADAVQYRTLKTATAAQETTTSCNNGDDAGNGSQQRSSRISSSSTTTITSSTTNTNSAHDYFVRTLRSGSQSSHSTSPTRRTADASPQVSSRGSSVSPQRHSFRATSPGSSRSASMSPARKPFYLNADGEETVAVEEKSGSQRPPLVRSETYEERCRHILGMAATASESRRSSADVKVAATTVFVSLAHVDTKSTTTATSSRSSSPSKRSTTPKLTSRPSSPTKSRRDISPTVPAPAETASQKRKTSRPSSPSKSAAVTSTPKPSSRSSSPFKQQRDMSPPSAPSHISNATIVLSPPAKRRITKPFVTVERSKNSSSKGTTPITHQTGGHRSTAQPVTERKESAPVYGSKSAAMAAGDDNETTTPIKIVRSSTTDGVIRTLNGSTKSANSTGTGTNKSSRPQKCIATKTLNLSPASAGKTTTTTTKSTSSSSNINASVDVQIDIQLAKSSREPSPNRIVPTPVSPDEDAADGGPPRFPDTVVEPDDPIAGRHSPTLLRRRGFGRRGTDGGIASGRHDGVSGGCRITEVEIEESCLIETDVDDEENDGEPEVEDLHRQKNTLKNEQIEVSVDANDPSLLSVQDKVLKVLSTVQKASDTDYSNASLRFVNAERIDSNVSGKITQFITIAENMSKQRVSKPFSQNTSSSDNVDNSPKTMPQSPADVVADGDECMLSVSDKISRFTAAAEPAKIAVPVPQKSPKLVATVERKLSRQQSRDQAVQAGDEEQPHEERRTAEKIPVARRSSAELQRVRSIFERRCAGEEELSGNKPKPKTGTSTAGSVWERASMRAERHVSRDLKLTGEFETNSSEYIKFECNFFASRYWGLQA